jgi:hypothetical protein
MTSQFDTSGVVHIRQPDLHWRGYGWTDFDRFTQGYVEALLSALCQQRWPRVFEAGGFAEPGYGPGFSDLAPETLARIMEDCGKRPAMGNQTSAGASFWRARQSGFKKWGWPSIETLPDRFPPLTPYLGDDGKVYLREGKQ